MKDTYDIVGTRVSKLFNNPLLSDITLYASDRTAFPAHRNILIGVTDFFETALSPESGFTESSTNTVELPEHSPAAVKAFLEYCYTGQYIFRESCGGIIHVDSDDDSEPYELSPPALDFEVYQLANYVLAVDVRDSAIYAMTNRLDGLSKNAMPCGQWLPGLVRAIYEAGEAGEYLEIEETVIDAVVEALRKRRFEFLASLEEVMKEYGEFSTAVLKKYATERVPDAPYCHYR